MKKDDLGTYFIKGGEIYKVIGYIDRPALELINTKTKQKETIVIGSVIEKEYSKLFVVQSENGTYNIDKIEPLTHLSIGGGNDE